MLWDNQLFTLILHIKMYKAKKAEHSLGLWTINRQTGQMLQQNPHFCAGEQAFHSTDRVNLFVLTAGKRLWVTPTYTRIKNICYKSQRKKKPLQICLHAVCLSRANLCSRGTNAHWAPGFHLRKSQWMLHSIADKKKKKHWKWWKLLWARWPLDSNVCLTFGKAGLEV